MEITITKQKDGTVKLAVQSSSEEITAAKEKALQNFTPHVEVKGFRKGKAPLSVVENNVKTDKLVEETLSIHASEAYQQAVKEHELDPVARPIVSVPALDERSTEEVSQTEWPKMQKEGLEFEITTFVTPEIELGDWEKALKDLDIETEENTEDETPHIETAKTIDEAKQKASEDVKNSQETLDKAAQKNPQQQEREKEDKIFETLIETSEFEVPQELVNGEAQQMFMQQVQMIEQLGMSYADYLKSQNKEPEDVQKELEADAERNIRVRFLIGAIVDEKKDDLPEEPKVKDVIELLKKIAG